MEARLVFAAFFLGILAIFAAGVLLERQRAATSHKSWLRGLDKDSRDRDAELEQTTKNHEDFMDRLRMKKGKGA